MDEKMKYATAGIVAVIIIIAAVYFSGMLTPKATADLSLTATLSPADPHAGEAAQYDVVIHNSGNLPVDSALLQFSVDGSVMGQATVSVPAGGSNTSTIKWVSTSAGSHSIRISIDAGNIIQETDESNNEYASTLSVAEREAPQVFAEIPHNEIVRAYYFNSTQAGLNQFLSILATGTEAQFYQGTFNRLKEGQLGILHYTNGSEAAAFLLSSDMTPSEFKAAAAIIAGAGMAGQERAVGGKEVLFFENRDGKTSYCAFREGGWGKVVMYVRFFQPVEVMGSQYGETTTCLDIIAKDFDPANATKFLEPISALAAPVPQDNPMLLDALVHTTGDKLYIHSFSDSNSAFLAMVGDSGTLVPGQCPGDLINESNKSICHLPLASLPGSTGQVELEAYVRKQGQYSIIVYILPIQGTNSALARQSALQTIKSIVFPGIPEYVWGTAPAMNAFCSFNDTFLCAPPYYDQNTSIFKMNLTLLSTRPVTISAWKCAQEMSPTPPFELGTPITIQPGQTYEMVGNCYIGENFSVNGSIMYLRAHLFANITMQGVNGTRLLNGSLMINNLGGGITLPGMGGGS